MKTTLKPGLSFIEEEILNDLVEHLEGKMPEASMLLVFGSRARGGSDENSDLDIAIVVDSDINKRMWDRLWEIKWEVLESIDAEEFPVSMVPIKKDEFLSNDSGLIRSIKEEGILWWKREN
jgi:predicted nucleotidyltransferase